MDVALTQTQEKVKYLLKKKKKNPYFSGWFSGIMFMDGIKSFRI